VGGREGREGCGGVGGAGGGESREMGGGDVSVGEGMGGVGGGRVGGGGGGVVGGGEGWGGGRWVNEYMGRGGEDRRKEAEGTGRVQFNAAQTQVLSLLIVWVLLKCYRFQDSMDGFTKW